jgi:hypothetical protein
MVDPQFREMRIEFPWLPEDYLRILPRAMQGGPRYGLEWLAAPTQPSMIGGRLAALSFPSAVWIGRRGGQIIGYENIGSGRPDLCEWGASQQRVKQRFGGIDDLILSHPLRSTDQRPVVAYDLRIRGAAFGSWHRSGIGLIADFIFSVGQESVAVASLLGQMDERWELTLCYCDVEQWLSVRKIGTGFLLRIGRHGSSGVCRQATREAAFDEILQIAHCNDGSEGQSFGSIVVPEPLDRV